MKGENKRACIAIDVSKGSSHLQGFYSAGVPASEVTRFEHTKSGFARVTDLFNLLNEKIIKNLILYSKILEHIPSLLKFIVNQIILVIWRYHHSYQRR